MTSTKTPSPKRGFLYNLRNALLDSPDEFGRMLLIAVLTISAVITILASRTWWEIGDMVLWLGQWFLIGTGIWKFTNWLEAQRAKEQEDDENKGM